MFSLHARYRVSLLLPVLAATGCSHISRYTEYMWGDIPDQYAGLSNPLPASLENISDGEKLYQMQCLTCHGITGHGDGPAGKQLVPGPANLAFTRKLPIATDAFFFWTISEGGKPFDTAMPAFGERFSDREIWQISHYINAGFNIDKGT